MQLQNNDFLTIWYDQLHVFLIGEQQIFIFEMWMECHLENNGTKS